MPQIIFNNNDNIKKIVDELQNGQVVAIPTETVYALAANAKNSQAVAKIYDLKNRPLINPLIVHCHSWEHAGHYAKITDIAKKIIQCFPNGPITLVLPAHHENGISKMVTAQLPTIAIRVSNHPIMQKILGQIDFPIAAPSANISGTISATSPEHIIENFPNHKNFYVLGGGACNYGIESTILDCSAKEVKILRPGIITASDIIEKTGIDVLEDNKNYKVNDCDNRHDYLKIQSPGQFIAHYSPSLPLIMNVTTPKSDEAFLNFGNGNKDFNCKKILNLSEKGCLQEAAKNLFNFMYILDKSTYKAIAVAPIPSVGIGIALNDKLIRASITQDS